MKEIITPRKVDKFLYNLAPYIVIICVFLTLAAIPFAPGLQGLDFDIGVFYLSSVSSLSVIGILLAGWSSNNKYSLIGGIRSGAQIISYELSVAMSLITMVILAGTMQFSGIVEGQRDLWFIFKGHIPALISFIIFLIAGTAETNRGPFDLPEAESELTAGFHTEYSGIKFALFYLTEFINMFIVSAVAATVFLGGWMPLHFGGLEGFNHVMDFIPPIIWFFLKTFGLIFVLMWFKWTFPRLRVDQILTLEWKYLLPINLFNILLMTVVVLTKFHF
jgi:NADH-quinone oxidoreductase subunit H